MEYKEYIRKNNMLCINILTNLSFKNFLDLKLLVNTTVNCYLRERVLIFIILEFMRHCKIGFL